MSSIFLGQIAALDGLRFEERMNFYEQLSMRLMSKNLVDELAASSTEGRVKFWSQSLQNLSRSAYQDFNQLKKVSDQRGPQHVVVVRKKKAILEAIKKLFSGCRSSGCAKNTEIVTFFITVLSDSSLRAMIGEDYASFLDSCVFSCKEFVCHVSDSVIESIHNSLQARLETKFCSKYLSLFSQLVILSSERSCLFVDASVLANWLVATVQDKDERLFHRMINAVDCLISHDYFAVFFSKICAFAQSLFRCYEQFFSSFMTTTHEAVCSFFYQFFSALATNREVQENCTELVLDLLNLQQPMLRLIIHLREEKFVSSVRFHRADKANDFPVFYRLLALLTTSGLSHDGTLGTDAALCHRNKRPKSSSALEEACDSIESASTDDVAIILDLKRIRGLLETKSVPNASVKRLQSTLTQIQNMHKVDVIVSLQISLLIDCLLKWNVQFDEDFMESIWKFSFSLMSRKSFRQQSFLLCEALSTSFIKDANSAVVSWLLFAFEQSLSARPAYIPLKDFCHIVNVCTRQINRDAPCDNATDRNCFCLSDSNLLKISEVIESTLQDCKPSNFNEFVDITISSAFLHCCNMIANEEVIAHTLSSLIRTGNCLSDKCDLYYFADQLGDFVKVLQPFLNSGASQLIRSFLQEAKVMFFNLLTTNGVSERDSTVLRLEDEVDFSPSCDDTLSANDFTSPCNFAVNRQERLRHSLLKAYLRLTTSLNYQNYEEVTESLKVITQGLSFQTRSSDLYSFVVFFVNDFIQFSSSTANATNQYIMTTFDLLRCGFRNFRKNQQVIAQFCEILAHFIEKLGKTSHERQENYLNFCQELLIVIILSQNDVTCCTSLLKSLSHCVVRMCRQRPDLLCREFKGKTLFCFALELVGHFCQSIAMTASDILRWVDWKDPAQSNTVIGFIKGLFSIEVSVEDADFLIDLKRFRVSIAQHALTVVLTTSPSSKRGRHLNSVVQMHQSGLLDFKSAKNVIEATVASSRDYATKLYIIVCLSEWLASNKLSLFPVTIFDYSSVQQFVSECLYECISAAVQINLSVQQVADIASQPAKQILKSCQTSVFAPTFTRCFLSKDASSVGRLKTAISFPNGRDESTCRDLGRFLMTACCFLPCNLAVEGNTIEELIKFCCFSISNSQTSNPLEPFVKGGSVSDLVTNICCASIEFWSTCDEEFSLVSLLSSCIVLNYLVKLSTNNPNLFTLLDFRQLLNVLLMAAQKLAGNSNVSNRHAVLSCFDSTLLAITTLLENSVLPERFNGSLIVVNVLANLRQNTMTNSQLHQISKILSCFLRLSNERYCKEIISELDLPMLIAESSLCGSIFSALVSKASIFKVINAVFNSYSSISVSSYLKSTGWFGFVTALEQRLEASETVEHHEMIVRIAKAFHQITVDGVIKDYKSFDLAESTSHTMLSAKLMCGGCLLHKNCQFSQQLFVIKVLINSTFSQVVEEKEAAIVCLQKLMQTDLARSAVKHTEDAEVREICRAISALGPICQEREVRRRCDWISQSATLNDVISTLTNHHLPFIVWIENVIKTIFKTHSLSSSFVLELQYLVGFSVRFCESIFFCVLSEFLLQSPSSGIENFTEALSSFLANCRCERKLRQLTSFILLLHSSRMFNETSPEQDRVSLPSIRIPYLKASSASLRLNDAYLANLFLECHFSSVLTLSAEAETILLTLVSHLANEDAVLGCQRLLSDYKTPLNLKHELLGLEFFATSEERKDFLGCCLQNFSVWTQPDVAGHSTLSNLPCARSTEGEFWSHLNLANEYLLSGNHMSASLILNTLDKASSDFNQVFVDSNRLLFDFVEKRTALSCFRRLLNAIDDKSRQDLSLFFLSYAEEQASNFQFCKHYKTLAVHWNLNKTILQLSKPDCHNLQQFVHHCVILKDIFVSLNCTNKAQSFVSALSSKLSTQYLPDFLLHLVKFEESSLYWETGEKDVALLLGKRCLTALESFATDNISVDAYLNVVRRYSQWLNESKCESADSILEDYLLHAERKAGTENLTNSKLHYAIAEFSDAQYTCLENYTKSQEFQAWCSVTKQSKENAIELIQAGEKSRFTSSLNRQSRIDDDRIADIQQRKASYLVYTVTNLSKCLIGGDTFDKSVYRFVDLWLNNTDDSKVADNVYATLKKVRLDKFIPLFPQLSARLSDSSEKSNFQTTLKIFLLRVSCLHPHHTLYNLFALAHANLDSSLTAKAMQTPRTSLASSNPIVDRGKAAEKIIKQVSTFNESLSVIVKLVRRFCYTYIELANVQLQNDGKSKSGTLTSLNTKYDLTALRDVSVLHIPTVTLNINPQGNYPNILYAVQFIDKYSTAGGINLPKIISIQCSDGVVRRQLIKGNDDMRQDAVMQQVFTAVNRLLCDSPAASRRQLYLSTYKVVPMSQRSGIVEWCEGTIPIAAYLAQGSKSAHVRYRPTDLTPNAARTAMETSSKTSVQNRITTFKDICSKLQPVFRYFFFERFVEPREFYLRRLTYTRSVAAWSMVGYILGLGDRHLNNILVHNETANLFHIDLGIAFDQGRLLPTPETIPFRLTRDIIDGLGVLRVEGDFRRACEITLALLRSSTDVILTICSILLHDPLYHWTLSPERANALQLNISKPRPRYEHLVGPGDTDIKDASVPQRSLLAERVMLRLREKLTGREDNFSLNVEGQVSYLIKQATDQRNLALVFHGWQPYL